VLTSLEGCQQHGLLPCNIAFEHDEGSTIRGGSEGYPGVPKAWQMWLAGDGSGVDEAVSKVRKTLHAHRRHECWPSSQSN
jgi:hypothetical protein